MIYIEEKIPEKIPGETSLFIKFNYNESIINEIKMLQVYNYNPKTKIWEISILDLSKLLDSLCVFDDIKLTLLKQEKISDKDIVLNESEYKTKPFDYQIEGIKYGLTHNKWLLLDAPGLGKTLQIIYLAQELKKRENIQHCLIVCGINTLKTNWEKEIKKHSDLSCCILGKHITKKGNIVFQGVQERIAQIKKPIEDFFVICNIETLRNEQFVKELQKSKVNKFDMIVVDEIHVCKDTQSQQTKGLMKLNFAKYCIGTTGTILTSSPLDAYVPLKWIGAEHSNHTNFKYFYCIYGGLFSHDLVGYKNISQLKSQMDNNTLRRTKDILNLPPKTIINEYVDMNDKQEQFYDAVKQGVVDEITKIELDATSVLSLVTRLRQVTAYPQLLTDSEIPSSKIDRAMDIIEQIISNNKKVVVFSTFKEPAKALYEKLLKIDNINPLLSTGDVDDITIANNIQKFQESDKNKVFVGTWSKCGTGITLTAATYMIFLDTPWTNAQYQQAQDRIYRVGTKENVTIYNLICSNTIDERVLEIVEDKELISDYVVDNKISNSTYLKLKQIIKDL